MSLPVWSAVDSYFEKRLSPQDQVLVDVMKANTTAELPAIDVSPGQGSFLHVLARSISARRILEIGTLGGYSTIWLARALADGGKLVTLELEPKHAEVAAANFRRAGLADRIELRLGDALESLTTLDAEKTAPFDFVFIDADKPRCTEYFDWAIRLSRPGALIVVDNVVREGEVLNANSDDDRVIGVRRFIEMLSHENRVTSTAVQTVGAKGYDGFVMAVVNL